MAKKGTMRVNEKGMVTDYYPTTTYDMVIDGNGLNLSTDISTLKTFKTSSETKLNGIAQGATKTEKSTTNGNIKINNTETAVYTHPSTAGNLHIPTGGASGQILRWSASGTAVWGAENNTTYSVATTSANGLMSAAMVTKLNGIATGANNYTHPGSGTNPHGTTKADIGLGNVNNWGATTAVNSTSTTTYATASAVKQAYDLATSALSAGGSASSGYFGSNRVRINLLNTKKSASITRTQGIILARWVPKKTGYVRIRATFGIEGSIGPKIYLYVIYPGTSDSSNSNNYWYGQAGISLPVGSVFTVSPQYFNTILLYSRTTSSSSNTTASLIYSNEDIYVQAGFPLVFYVSLYSTSSSSCTMYGSLIDVCYDEEAAK